MPCPPFKLFEKEGTFANSLADLRDHRTKARSQQWPWSKSCVLEANWYPCPSDFRGFRLQLTRQGAGGRNLGKVTLPLVSALGARGTYKDSLVSIHKLGAFVPSESPAGLPPATRFCVLESYQFQGGLGGGSRPPCNLHPPLPIPSQLLPKEDAGDGKEPGLLKVGVAEQAPTCRCPGPWGPEDLLFILLQPISSRSSSHFPPAASSFWYLLPGLKAGGLGAALLELCAPSPKNPLIRRLLSLPGSLSALSCRKYGQPPR